MTTKEAPKKTGAAPTTESAERVVKLRGLLDFDDEVGHGWGFQDEKSISHNVSDFGVWGNQQVWDATSPTRQGRTQKKAEVLHEGEWRPIPDPTLFRDNPHPYGVSQGEITRVTVEWTDGAVEERLSNTLLVEGWSYEGLHLLKNGDKLTIYDKKDPSKIVWQGTIDLIYPTSAAEEVFTHGRPSQNSANPNQWATWFLGHYPAELETMIAENAGEKAS